MIWAVEDEVRLLIELEEEANSLFDKNRKYMIIPKVEQEFYKNINVTIGPEIEDVFMNYLPLYEIKTRSRLSYSGLREKILVPFN